MCSDKIIAPVEVPTDWVPSLVVVQKPNKLRICINPKHLNKAIMRPHYALPTIEEMTPELSKAKIFTVLDAKKWIWASKTLGTV